MIILFIEKYVVLCVSIWGIIIMIFNLKNIDIVIPLLVTLCMWRNV